MAQRSSHFRLTAHSNVGISISQQSDVEKKILTGNSSHLGVDLIDKSGSLPVPLTHLYLAWGDAKCTIPVQAFFFEMKRLSPNQSSIHSIILLLVVTFRFEYSDLPTFAAPVTAVHLNNCPIRLACSDKVVSRVLCDINDHRRARGVLVGLLTLW